MKKLSYLSKIAPMVEASESVAEAEGQQVNTQDFQASYSARTGLRSLPLEILCGPLSDSRLCSQDAGRLVVGRPFIGWPRYRVA
jgi:hypothetical protein